MNLTKLEKATKILNSIKELDAEIIKIESLAEVAANKRMEATVKITLEDLEKEGEEKLELDEDGSLYSGFKGLISGYMNPISFRCTGQLDEKKNKTTFEQDVNDITLLHILGFLAADKKAKRENLLRQLKRLGLIAQ
jgi:hypothetical protein